MRENVLGSNIIRTPVDCDARKVVSKPPWWAYLQSVEQALPAIKSSVTIEVFASITSDPPPGVQNRKGEMVSGMVVIGYSNLKTGRKTVIAKRGETPKPNWFVGDGWNPRYASGVMGFKSRKQIWYVLCLKCGGIFRMGNNEINRTARMSRSCPDCFNPLRRSCSIVDSTCKIVI